MISAVNWICHCNVAQWKALELHGNTWSKNGVELFERFEDVRIIRWYLQCFKEQIKVFETIIIIICVSKTKKGYEYYVYDKR